jgi:sugar lactone lactonase YvrE
MPASHGLSEFRQLGRGVNGPEGVAVDRDGNVYGGGADGVIRRLAPDGAVSAFAKVSDGQLGGLAFDREDNLFVCDGFTSKLIKVTRAGEVSVFAEWAGNTRLHVPNFPVFDADGDLWVSNSFNRPLSEVDFAAVHRDPRPDGALVRLKPDGRGEVVVDGMYMPNGLAIDPEEEWIYVLQSTRENCVRVRLGEASPEPEPYGPPLGGGPDGMAFDEAGELVITLPSAHRLVVVARDGVLRTLADDPGGEVLPFPNNCAFGGSDFQDLFVANMHTDHFPTLRHERPGHPLFNRRTS